ncbi:hypothetical protein RFI_29673, partial [Reticulomyxa filosa]
KIFEKSKVLPVGSIGRSEDLECTGHSRANLGVRKRERLTHLCKDHFDSLVKQDSKLCCKMFASSANISSRENSKICSSGSLDKEIIDDGNTNEVVKAQGRWGDDMPTDGINVQRRANFEQLDWIINVFMAKYTHISYVYKDNGIFENTYIHKGSDGNNTRKWSSSDHEKQCGDCGKAMIGELERHCAKNFSK